MRCNPIRVVPGESYPKAEVDRADDGGSKKVDMTTRRQRDYTFPMGLAQDSAALSVSLEPQNGEDLSCDREWWYL